MFFIALHDGHFHAAKSDSKIEKRLNHREEDDEGEYNTGKDQSKD